MSETKAAFAGSSKRSLKNLPYGYTKGSGYKYSHKLSQTAITLNSRRNWLIDLTPKNVMNSNFMYILYSKPLREPNIKIGDRDGIAKCDLLFRRFYKPQFTKKFEIVARTSGKPLKIHNEGINRSNFTC